MIDIALMLLLNLSNTSHNYTIPFPVAPGGVTFCFDQFKNVDGFRQKYIECNYVEMKKKKLIHLRDYLENWTAQK